MDRGILFRETAGHEIIETIADHTDMGDPKRLVEGMLGQMLQMHRTHQQDVIRTVTQFIRGYARGYMGKDLRNEAAVELANLLEPIITEHNLPRH